MVRYASGNPPSLAAPTTSSSSLPTLEELFQELQPAASRSEQPPSRDSDPGEGGEHGNSNNDNNSGAGTIIENNSKRSTTILNNSERSTTTAANIERSTINNASSISDVSNIINLGSNSDLSSMANKDSMDTDKMDAEKSTTPIPRMDYIGAAIFVPISDFNKLLSPLEFAPDSPDYHRAALSAVTNHEASVRDNITALFQREILRINLDAEAADPHFDYLKATASVQAQHEAALRHDCEDMIANMRTPHDPSKNYNIKTIPVPNLAVPITYVPINSPRESAAQEVMKVVSAASRELASFDAHVASIRGAIEKKIEDAVLRGEEDPSDRMDVDVD